VPFAVFVYFVIDFVGRTVTADAAEFYLRNKAADVADKIDLSLRERRLDLLLWVREPTAVEALLDRDDAAARERATEALNTLCRVKEVYDLLAVFDASGRPVAWNTQRASGETISEENRLRLEGADVYNARWFIEALGGREVPVDWHRDSLLLKDVTFPSKEPSDYSVGYAAPIRDPARSDTVIGVWYSLLGWRAVQELLDRAQIDARAVDTERYRSAYAFLWKDDANTIIGHPDRSLYGTYVGGPPVNLPELREAVLKNPDGFHIYDYQGKSKRAGFRRTLGAREGGFGWIVGVGVKDEQVFEPARVAGTILLVGSLAAALGLLVTILVVSRTVTRPLVALSQEADRVARGELGARVVPSGPAETAALAQSFNRMAEDLEASREKLVRAEKELAWREMARQVSHEIKNPLTPMKLSIQLLERAWRDRSPEFENILQRAIATIDRQIESLRRIATDFKAFAGSAVHKRENIQIQKLLEDTAALFAAAAESKRVRIVVSSEPATVLGDPEELQRAVVNLLDNALQAAPPETAVDLSARTAHGRVRICVLDRGAGVPAELRPKLFTPYFSTRTHGTGLGLSIVRRIAEDHGGAALLDESTLDGTAMVLELPLATPSSAAPAEGAQGPPAEKGAPAQRLPS